MDSTEAYSTGVLLLFEFVHAAGPSVEAERALRQRLDSDYAPITASVLREHLLAPTPA